MVDQEAAELVKEALRSGKTEKEVITLMKQAGYTDEAISELMAGVSNQPGNNLAGRAAEKNKIQIQDMPRMGPRMMPLQPGASMIDWIKLAFLSFIHPKTSADELREKAGFLPGFTMVALGGVVVVLVVLLMTLLMGGFVFGGPPMGSLIIIMVVIFLLYLGFWLLLGSVSWLIGKLLGTVSSYKTFVGGFGFAYSSISVVSMAVGIVILYAYLWINYSSMASLYSYSNPSNAISIVIMQFLLYAAIFVLSTYSEFIFFIFTRELLKFSDERAVWNSIISTLVTAIIISLISVALVWAWLSPLLGSGFVSQNGSSSASVAVCKMAASTCEANLAAGVYTSGTQCASSCRVSCKDSSGNDVTANAYTYCISGLSDYIE